MSLEHHTAPDAANPAHGSDSCGDLLRELETIYRTAPVGLTVIDRELRYIRINERLAEINGIPVEDHIGRTVREILPNLADQAEALCRQVFDTGEPLVDVELVGETPARPGVTRTWRESWHPVKDENGRTFAISIVAEEITERKKAEEELRHSEELFRQFSDNITNLAWIADGDGWIYWYNQRWYEYTGTTLEEMKGWGWEKVHNPDHIGRVTAFVKEAWKRNAPFELTFPLRGADGRYRWFLTRAVPVADHEGRIYRWIGTNTDITEQKAAEAAIRDRETRFRTLADNLPDVVSRHDASFRYLYANPRIKDYLGKTPEELVGKSFREVGFPDETCEFFEEHMSIVFQTQEPYALEFKNPLGTQYLYARLVPEFDEFGSIVSVLILNTDITAQRLAQEKIRENEQRFRTLANDAPAFMFTADAETNMDFVNRQWLDFVGIDHAHGFGKVWADVTHPDDVQPMLDVYTRAVATNTPYQFEIRQRHRDGDYRWVLWKGLPNTTADGRFTGMMGIGFDVTEQKLAQEKIRESEQRFRTLADNLPQMVWMTEPDGTTDWQNLRWREFFGKHHKGHDWMQALHPEDVQRTTDTWFGSVASGRDYEIEYRFLDRSTGEYRWFLAKASPVKDENGRITKWFGTCTDIHDQKTAAERLEKRVAERTRELTAANAELTRSNHDLQQFAHITSHDLKEPLRKIKVFVGMLEKELDDCATGQGKAYFEKVRLATERMQAMIDGILSYSSLQATAHSRHEPVDLNRTIAQVQADLELLVIQKNARIAAEPLPQIEGAPVLLHQLFYNLMANALKFVRPGVAPLVSVRADYPSADTVEISVADNGIGFEPVYAERIFDTFVRLKPKDEYEGTGLGLALCKQIAQRHGGAIRAEALPGQGAVFTVTLPLRQPV